MNGPADELDIPLNTEAGLVMLGARDAIAEEAFEPIAERKTTTVVVDD